MKEEMNILDTLTDELYDYKASNIKVKYIKLGHNQLDELKSFCVYDNEDPQCFNGNYVGKVGGILIELVELDDYFEIIGE